TPLRRQVLRRPGVRWSRGELGNLPRVPVPSQSSQLQTGWLGGGQKVSRPAAVRIQILPRAGHYVLVGAGKNKYPNHQRRSYLDLRQHKSSSASANLSQEIPDVQSGQLRAAKAWMTRQHSPGALCQ